MSRRSGPSVVVLACAIALLSSALLPWVNAGLGTTPVAYRPTGLPPLLVGIALVAIAMVAGVVADGVGVRDRRPSVGLAVPAFALVACVVLITVVETVATQLPMPTTVRRVGVQLSAGPGLWLATGALAVAVAAASGVTLSTLRRYVRGHGEAGTLLRLAAAGIVAAAAAGLAILRYRPWIDGTVSGQRLDLQGWALPWLGPFSLVLVWVLVLGAAALVVGRIRIGAALVAGTGWAVTFLAGLGVALGSQLGRTRVGSIDLHAIGISGSVDAQTAFRLAPGVWVALALGWVAALGGALALWSVVRVPEGVR